MHCWGTCDPSSISSLLSARGGALALDISIARMRSSSTNNNKVTCDPRDDGYIGRRHQRICSFSSSRCAKVPRLHSCSLQRSGLNVWSEGFLWMQLPVCSFATDSRSYGLLTRPPEAVAGCELCRASTDKFVSTCCWRWLCPCTLSQLSCPDCCLVYCLA